MAKMTKMSAFTENNQEAMTTLEMAQVKGGKSAACTTSESYSTNDGGCSDTENWTYDDSGHIPIKGVVNYDDGTYSPIYP